MESIKNMFQSADWKSEKHAPVIESAKAEKENVFTITLTVGKQIPHPNTTAHHISNMELYFLPEGAKFPVHIARAEFASHGASAEGADSSGVYTPSTAVFSLKTEKPGTLLATSYCNIHGLWESSASLSL